MSQLRKFWRDWEVRFKPCSIGEYSTFSFLLGGAEMNGDTKGTLRNNLNPRTLPSVFAFSPLTAESVTGLSSGSTAPARYSEKNLIESAKVAKGRRNPDIKLWFIRYGNIRGTDLAKHIVLDAEL